MPPSFHFHSTKKPGKSLPSSRNPAHAYRPALAMRAACCWGQVIAREVVDYLRECGDEVARGEAVAQLADLAERYAPDHQWFVDTINELFEVAGEQGLACILASEVLGACVAGGGGRSAATGRSTSRAARNQRRKWEGLMLAPARRTLTVAAPQVRQPRCAAPPPHARKHCKAWHVAVGVAAGRRRGRSESQRWHCTALLCSQARWCPPAWPTT